MATSIYLGNPPENIRKWIEENYKPEVDMTKVPLTFTAEDDGSSVSLLCYDCSNTYDVCDSWCEFEYSMTGKDDDWQTYDTGSVIPLNKDETVYFRCPREKDDSLNPNINGLSQYVNYGYYEIMKFHFFKMEGSIKANGNIQFLLDKTGTMMEAPTCCYYHLFYDPTSENEENTSLTQAPDLPATTLADYCYGYMFYNCNSLTQAPDLPATTLADYCYYSMFSVCTSLTQAPSILPATTLAYSCYYSMFQGCTSLIQAPELPAATLVDECYIFMFAGCESLNNVNVSFTAWDPSNATEYWLDYVAYNGTFICPTALPDTPRDESHIPYGWTRTDKQ